jgi:hypothetical protein
VLFNLGLIALAAPVNVPAQGIWLDWRFLIAVTWLATVFLWRGRVSRWLGAVLLAAYAARSPLTHYSPRSILQILCQVSSTTAGPPHQLLRLGEPLSIGWWSRSGCRQSVGRRPRSRGVPR